MHIETGLSMITLREAVAHDEDLLWRCLTIITGESRKTLATEPSSAKYVQGWPRLGDFGVVAERSGRPVGGIWARQFTLDDGPFVWIDQHTPEIAVAVDPAHRNQGLGGLLVAELIKHADPRCAGLCLNVREENPARRLYARLGFTEIPGCCKPNRFGSISIGMALDFAARGRAMTAPAPFLRSTSVLDADHPSVAALAARLAEGLAGPEMVAAACFDWVRDRITHTADVGLGPVTIRASDVLAAGTGLCYAKSHLLVALLRANSIPAGLCYQRLSIDGAGPPFCLHGMVGVRLPGMGWYRCDPRGDKPGIATRFDPPTECLAYAPSLAGEADLPGIHPDPWPHVLDKMASHATLDTLAVDLPDT